MAGERLQAAPPVFDETLGGALIDAARINVMAALEACPAFERRIVLAGEPEPPTVHECLAEAMEWLNMARALSIEQNPAALTSLHLVEAGR